MSEEQWRPVVGYEGLYEVSNQGAVRALRRIGVYRGRWGESKMVFPARIMKIGTAPNGYQYVKLKKPNGPSKHYLCHRLVMAAFVGDPPFLQVNHKDGDKKNNRVENLEYCTAMQNIRHCIDVLGKKRGEGAGTSKLKEMDIPLIRGDKRTLREIAKDYGVTLQAIWYVKKRINWGHV
jgi:hypothetical protein